MTAVAPASLPGLHALSTLGTPNAHKHDPSKQAAAPLGTPGRTDRIDASNTTIAADSHLALDQPAPPATTATTTTTTNTTATTMTTAASTAQTVVVVTQTAGPATGSLTTTAADKRASKSTSKSTKTRKGTAAGAGDGGDPAPSQTQTQTQTPGSHAAAVGKPLNKGLVRLIMGAAGISKRKLPPLLPETGLTIVERHFHQSPPDKNQVLMAVYGTLRLPPQATQVSQTRLLDIIRLAQSEHFRLASYIDYESKTARLLAPTAAGTALQYRVADRAGDETLEAMVREELNANLDVRDNTKPLWKVALATPASWAGDGLKLDPIAAAASPYLDAARCFDVVFTFHHCIGDGLSMWAFARSFFALCTAENLNAPTLALETVGVNTSAPPLLDNLICPNVFEVIPPALGVIGQFLKKGGKNRFGHLHQPGDTMANDTSADKDNLGLRQPSVSTSPWLTDGLSPASIHAAAMLAVDGSPMVDVQPSPSKDDDHDLHDVSSLSCTDMYPTSSMAALTPVYDAPPVRTSGKKSLQSPAISAVPPVLDKGTDAETGSPAHASRLPPLPKLLLLQQAAPRTSTRLTIFDAAFVSDLRQSAKKNKTTIAAVLIVASLAAIRSTFAAAAKTLGCPLPDRQGWVVTTSMRHLIPGSQLLAGGDKQTDPSTRIFGGYGGSVTDPSLGVSPKADFWDRCRNVRRRIGSGLFTSMRRMKLANWVYRHPAVYRFLESKADLAKMTRAYSVELANLGAWDYMTATPDSVSDTDTRFRLDKFGGALSSAFVGARALFSLGVITLGSDMSVTVSYDCAAVSEPEAEAFVGHLRRMLGQLRSMAGKVRVGDLTGEIPAKE
ncbi:hypothetical protein BC831DRAFT_467991 [Entophlyctis helioformis]|nr:hypothetical protein BC831DRAFT_467991 [Entophlyctis helioformis]